MFRPTLPLALILTASQSPPLVLEEPPPSLIGEAPLTDGLPGFYGPRPRNVLMFTVDTFRWDYLARHGGQEGVVPFLDGIAAQGLSLDRHTSCSDWTFPSLMCILGGITNVDLGFMPKLSQDYRKKAPEDRWTLSRHLADAGYYTALFNTNSWLNENWLNDQGYTYQYHPDDIGGCTGITNAALDHLTSAVDVETDPWFLHIHVKEPHAAYKPPDEYLDGLDDLDPIDYDLTDKDVHYDVTGTWDDLPEEERALVLQHMLVRYAGEMSYLDDQLAAIWEGLEDLGMLEDTLVVFVSDHGEQFWEHDEQTHAFSLFRQENDAMAMFWSRNMEPVGFTEPTNHIDIAPTILRALGMSIPDEVTGVPAGEGAADRPIFGEVVARWGPVQGVTVGDTRLTYRWTTGDKWLFDLAADPWETQNLYDPEDTRVQALWKLLQPKIDAMKPLATEHEEVDPGP